VIGDASRAIDNQGSLASAFSAWEEAGVGKVECEALTRA
jgi:hypothetical protein